MLSRIINLPEDLDETNIGEIRSRLREASQDDGCRVILFTGNDNRFCLGMNLGFLSTEARRGNFESLGGYVALIQDIRRCPKVTLAVVQGEAIGGGLGIAASCDFVLAGERARFGLPEALFGMFPGTVIPLLFSRCLPDHVKKLALTMKTIDADEAKHMGLVDQWTRDDQIERELRIRIKDFSRCHSDSVKAIKSLAGFQHNATLDRLLEEGMSLLKAHLSRPEVWERLSEYAAHGIAGGER